MSARENLRSAIIAAHLAEGRRVVYATTTEGLGDDVVTTITDAVTGERVVSFVGAEHRRPPSMASAGLTSWVFTAEVDYEVAARLAAQPEPAA